MNHPTTATPLTLTDAERRYCDSRGIDILTQESPGYPAAFLTVPDAPQVLFRLGRADLNAPNMISMVGTRKMTPYGETICNQVAGELKERVGEATIVSGLAYGVDAAAHRAALSQDLPTVAVLAHGLDMIYPAVHRDLARRIVQSGGALITEYVSTAKPYRNRFLERNRLIAALSEATLLVESEDRGGGMATCRNALAYGRKVLAVPGRVTDRMSVGCLHLIGRGTAGVFTGVADLVKMMGWSARTGGESPEAAQLSLFPELEGDCLGVYQLLKQVGGALPIDTIVEQTGLRAHAVMAALGEMELDGIVMRHPANRFEAL